MVSRMIVALSVAALSLTGLASAQENATLTLRSGERLNVQVMDLGGVGFTVKVNGQERQIPMGDVAVLDFTGGGELSASDYDKLSGGQHVMWLKNGQTVTGQLTDIGGSGPLRISFRTDSGDRDFSSSEVSRIVFARPNNVNAPSTASTAVPTTGSDSVQGLTVSAQQQWTQTGLIVRRGEILSVSATGQIKIGGPGNPTADPGGVSPQTTAPGSPVPNAAAGALIGRVGNGRPFLIGNQTRVRMVEAGQLFLGINDGHLEDNEGAFQVTVQRVNR